MNTLLALAILGTVVSLTSAECRCPNPSHIKTVNINADKDKVMDKILSVYRDRYTETAAVLQFGFGFTVGSSQSDVMRLESDDYPNSICFLGDIKGAKIAVDGVETVANIEIKGFTDVLPDGTVDTGVMLCKCSQRGPASVDFCNSVLSDEIDTRMDQVKCRLEGNCPKPL